MNSDIMTIKFEDVNYKWQVIDGKRCLVPIDEVKEKSHLDILKESNEADKFTCNKFRWVLLRLRMNGVCDREKNRDDRFALIGIDTFVTGSGNFNNAHGVMATTIPSLFEEINRISPSWIKDLKKVN